MPAIERSPSPPPTSPSRAESASSNRNQQRSATPASVNSDEAQQHSAEAKRRAKDKGEQRLAPDSVGSGNSRSRREDEAGPSNWRRYRADEAGPSHRPAAPADDSAQHGVTAETLARVLKRQFEQSLDQGAFHAPAGISLDTSLRQVKRRLALQTRLFPLPYQPQDGAAVPPLFHAAQAMHEAAEAPVVQPPHPSPEPSSSDSSGSSDMRTPPQSPNGFHTPAVTPDAMPPVAICPGAPRRPAPPLFGAANPPEFHLDQEHPQPDQFIPAPHEPPVPVVGNLFEHFFANLLLAHQEPATPSLVTPRRPQVESPDSKK